MAVETRSSRKKKCHRSNEKDEVKEKQRKRVHKKACRLLKKETGSHLLKPNTHLPYKRRSLNRKTAQEHKIAVMETSSYDIKEIKEKLTELGSIFTKKINTSASFTEKESLDFFQSHMAPYVRWHKIDLPKEKSLSKISDFKTDNTIFQLYFCNVPWLHVAKSKDTSRDYGLFASRVFLNNEFLGIYVGYKQTKSTSEYRLKDVDATNIKENLLFGCHFINDPYYKTDKKTGLREDGSIPKEDPNCKYCTDYLVQATRKIEKNEEILAVYNWDN